MVRGSRSCLGMLSHHHANGYSTLRTDPETKMKILLTPFGECNESCGSFTLHIANLTAHHDGLSRDQDGANIKGNDAVTEILRCMKGPSSLCSCSHCV